MAMRAPTPELIDAVQPDVEPHEPLEPHVRRRLHGWPRAIAWGAVALAVAAIVWRLTQR
jgi:hypothetical protein